MYRNCFISFSKNGEQFYTRGGPFRINKDEGVWFIPKDEFGENENPLEAAKQDDPVTVEIEWPPESGKKKVFPEIDNA